MKTVGDPRIASLAASSSVSNGTNSTCADLPRSASAASTFAQAAGTQGQSVLYTMRIRILALLGQRRNGHIIMAESSANVCQTADTTMRRAEQIGSYGAVVS
jgi:hypothetical protein